MDKTTTSRTGDARTLGEAISDPTSESKPEKVYGNIVWYLEIKYPEIEIFISYFTAVCGVSRRIFSVYARRVCFSIWTRDFLFRFGIFNFLHT